MSASETNATRAKHERHSRIDRAAGYLALAGAALGIIAGLVDVAVGASIRDWVGNKLHTTTLGVATVILSTVSLVAAVGWLRSGGGASERRLATVLALLLPGCVCFTTIGRLWLLSGVLLLIAGALILATSSRHELTDAVDEHRWRIGLTAVLGGYYVFLGAGALPKAAGFVGIFSGLAIWLALRVAPRSHRLAVGMLAVGALAFAFVTWWSVVTPIIAILVLTIGRGALRPRDAHGLHRVRLPPPAGAQAGVVGR
jgi:hypothetical protein